ncbi:hypothetical protein CALCODRAFT_504722 [Calocera cornea HHB12733]|uniref:SGNH hydrolase-type esterase domain-containing protein n=1 Tax=Calocera cornea HHB12733 TaxID=1353952 RepID=A0A165C9K2_9BASI|nr:hypothetical protein CALCODRAFT_504722 [Calocera cornea HHB12733]
MVSRFWQKSWFSHDPWDPSPAHSPLYIPPTVVIIALGANDDGWGVPVFHFTSSLRGLVERLVEAFRRSLEDVVLLTPFYSMGAGHSRFAAATASLVSDLRAEWHPSPSPSSSSSSDEQHMPRIHSISTQGWLTPALAPDGIHPSVEGNEVMARRLVEAWERGWEDGG